MSQELRIPVLPKIVQLLINASISRIELIHDVDENHNTICRWYNVVLELDDSSSVQTMEFTVTYGSGSNPDEHLDPILIEMGWSGEVRHIVQWGTDQSIVDPSHPIVTNTHPQFVTPRG